MAINLSRNTKVYFTSNVSQSTGAIPDVMTNFNSSNTFEIQVQDGYSFSQGTNQTTIQISESGATPTRGQRAFNTSLNAVEFSFSTYIRPLLSTNVSAAEKVLWNALLGSKELDAIGAGVTGLSRAATTGPGASVATVITVATYAIGDIINLNGATSAGDWNQAAIVTAVPAVGTYTVELTKAPAVASGTTATGTLKAYTGQWAQGAGFSYASTMGSNKNQLQKFGMIFVVDSVVYLVDNCALDQASVDFGLDAISMVAWTGKGTTLRQAGSVITRAALLGVAQAVTTTANYITNKLSTMTLESNIGGAQNTDTASTTYAIPITGGNITIANNINYLVPTNLGIVNTAIGYYTGQRSITGNVTAYLRTGGSGTTAADSGQLLNALLTGSATVTEPKFRVQLEMGGKANAIHLEFDMPGTVLQIPAVNVADVVATTINFVAQGYTPDVNGASTPSFDITKTNDLTIRYFSA
jgi:hypothetical protein